QGTGSRCGRGRRPDGRGRRGCHDARCWDARWCLRHRRLDAGVRASDVPLLDVLGLHHSARPPSRAPSAIAATRPWYRLPPRSNTTDSTPVDLARSATSPPTFLARSVLSPSRVRTSASMVDADATVLPTVSSTTWTKTWRLLRVTTRRGRAAVPVTFLRTRRWRRPRAALLPLARLTICAMA